MIQEARHYLESRNIVRREPLYSANRMSRIIGDLPATSITTETICLLRSELSKTKLSPRTIESTISDIITVVQHCTGKTLDSGHRLRLQKPQPQPVDRTSIDSIWPHCEPWLQAWVAFSYWTGLRLTDGIRALKEHRGKPLPEILRWTASKTGKNHIFPIPGWLRSKVSDSPYRFRTASDFAKRQVRAGLHAACIATATDIICPKQFRQRSITEWSVANASAGAIIHGRDLGILNHYVDPLTVLESAAPRVRLPACFGASVDAGEALMLSYRRLDSEGQQIVSNVASRLAGAG